MLYSPLQVLVKAICVRNQIVKCAQFTYPIV